MFNRSARLHTGNNPVKEHSVAVRKQLQLQLSSETLEDCNGATQMKITNKQHGRCPFKPKGGLRKFTTDFHSKLPPFFSCMSCVFSLPHSTIYTPIYLVWVSCHQPIYGRHYNAVAFSRHDKHKIWACKGEGSAFIHYKKHFLPKAK